MKKSFEYDVAISFREKDEELAIEISNRLSSRISTFVYSEQQKKIAGSDGEITFNRVYGKESKLVIVLYRNDWGETLWSRIEKTAI